MFSKLSIKATLVASLAATLVSGDNVFILHSAPMVVGRLDPLISPNAVSSHVHVIVGGSKFNYKAYNYDELVSSDCTSIEVPKDKSNYWAPGIFSVDASGKFKLMKSYFNLYYLLRTQRTDKKIYAFPKGLRMIAGDINRRTYNPASFADQAISFHCVDGANSQETPAFPNKPCPGGLRVQVFFPSCWDGVNLDSANHKSHMAYPIDAYNGGECPSTHPKKLISLFYEHVADSPSYPYTAGKVNWALATGDTTGYSSHADFQNGWSDIPFLQQIVDDCSDGHKACDFFQPTVDSNAAAACRPVNDIYLEDVGFYNALTFLPGDNNLYSATTTKAPRNPGPPVPVAGPVIVAGSSTVATQLSTGQRTSLIPAGWSYNGCYADPAGGRALSAASTTIAGTLEISTCIAFCAGKGYKYAGAEFGQECYCANALTGGAALKPASACNIQCAGNKYQDCGGPGTVSVWVKN